MSRQPATAGEEFQIAAAGPAMSILIAMVTGALGLLVRDSNDPASAGYLRSSSFGTPVTTAGGVFGSGGPRALQLAARVSF